MTGSTIIPFGHEDLLFMAGVMVMVVGVIFWIFMLAK